MSVCKVNHLPLSTFHSLIQPDISKGIVLQINVKEQTAVKIRSQYIIFSTLNPLYNQQTNTYLQ